MPFACGDDKIRTFIDSWNDDRAHPFVWTKTAEEILSKANRQNLRSLLKLHERLVGSLVGQPFARSDGQQDHLFPLLLVLVEHALQALYSLAAHHRAEQPQGLRGSLKRRS